MSEIGWLKATVRGALVEALALILPVVCAGCDEPDTTLCETCGSALAPVPTRRDGAVPVWSGLAFEGVAARVIRALKEDGRTGLARALAPALREAVSAVTSGEAVAAASGAVVFVPLPTSRAAYRRRGYRVVELIARQADLRCLCALRIMRSTADQRGLGRAARARNVAGSMAVRARFAAGMTGLRVVVIDDVVTTGATLEEAVRALRAAGADVIGAATVAGTLRHGRRT